MAQIERIKVRKDYLAIQASGRRWVTPAFVLQTKKADDSERSPHVGFTVTKKVGNAVIRNRVRRRLKEAAREIFPLKARDGWDYIVVGRYACMDMAYARIKSDMKWALSKLGADADLKTAPRQNKGQNKDRGKS